MICRQGQSCTAKDVAALDRFKLSCELEVSSQNCAELARNHPDWAPLIRQCDLPSLCDQQKEFAEGTGAACLRGYKNAMIDLGISLKDMSLSLAGFVEDTWENFKKNNEKRTQFLKECNKSIACKRDLVKDDHRYNKLSDDKLNRYSATFLYVEAEDMKAYMSSFELVRPKPYVPISQRPIAQETTLNVEQQDKLKRLMSMVGDNIKEQYQRYSCYHPLAQEELKCYALGNVIDPTLLAGYFVKGGRAAFAISRMAKEERALAAAGKAASVGFRNRAELITKYLEFSPTTTAQNEKWIALAEKGASKKTVFLDVENSQIKNLNDSLKDKNLVTSLTNFHKDLLSQKMDILQREFPELVIDKYSDFKSMRFALSGKIPSDIEKRLGRVFSETNEEFASHLKKNRSRSGVRSRSRVVPGRGGVFGRSGQFSCAVLKTGLNERGAVLYSTVFARDHGKKIGICRAGPIGIATDFPRNLTLGWFDFA